MRKYCSTSSDVSSMRVIYLCWLFCSMKIKHSSYQTLIILLVIVEGLESLNNQLVSLALKNKMHPNKCLSMCLDVFLIPTTASSVAVSVFFWEAEQINSDILLSHSDTYNNLVNPPNPSPRCSMSQISFQERSVCVW